MNRIVREHYPVEKLPEDLREGRPAGTTVTVTVEDEGWETDFELEVEKLLHHPEPVSLRDARAMVQQRLLDPDEAVARIRALRDEWDT